VERAQGPLRDHEVTGRGEIGDQLAAR